MRKNRREGRNRIRKNGKCIENDVKDDGKGRGGVEGDDEERVNGDGVGGECDEGVVVGKR